MTCYLRRSLLIVAAVTTISGTSLAEPLDSVGIYFDEAYTQSCVSLQPFVAVTAYLVVKNPSSSTGISGWEGELVIDGDILVTSYTPSGSALNVLTPPQFMVGLQTPFAYSQAILLATLTCIPFEAGTLTFQPLPQPSVADATTPLYAAGDNPGLLVPMIHAIQPESLPLAVIAAGECDTTVYTSGETDDAGICILPATAIVYVEGEAPAHISYSSRMFTASSEPDRLFSQSRQYYGFLDWALGYDGSVHLLYIPEQRLVVLDAANDIQQAVTLQSIRRIKRVVCLNSASLVRDTRGTYYSVPDVINGAVTLLALPPDEDYNSTGNDTQLLTEEEIISRTTRSIHVRNTVGQEYGTYTFLSHDAIDEIQLLEPTLINRHLYFQVLRQIAQSPIQFTGSVLVVAPSGDVLARLPIDSVLRFHDTRPTHVAGDGSVVQINVIPNAVEVRRWRLRAQAD